MLRVSRPSARTWPTGCSTCCCSTASTTSTSPPATATPSCGWRRGCAPTGTSSSWPPRPASAPPTRPTTSCSARSSGSGVDRVDLWQLHNLADPIEWDIALSPGGAIEAAVRAKRGGPGPVRRRHRARRPDRRDPPPQPAAVRVRLGAAAVQLGDDAESVLRGELRRPAGDLRRARGGGADDQVGRPPAVARPRAHRRDLVRAATRTRTRSTCRCGGRSAATACT